MSHVPRGVRLSLSPARKMSIETLTHAQRVPSAPMARSLNVSAVAAARQALNPAPSWTTIFVRAYGLVCRDCVGEWESERVTARENEASKTKFANPSPLSLSNSLSLSRWLVIEQRQ